MTIMLAACTAVALIAMIAMIRDYQQRTNAGVLALSRDNVLPGRWADRTLHLMAAGRLNG